tara:strand:- start:1205 stop:1645 length:441 start_codon:yes stop_codon:yes gene_type:complete
MKVILPTSNEQVISIMPRKSNAYLDSDYSNRVESNKGVVEANECASVSFQDYNGIDMTITRDGDRETETLTDLKVVSNGNYVNVYFSSTILKEGFGYFIEMKQNNSLYYRDKLYVTSQQDFKVKHKESQLDYTPYDEADDNTYIIR